MTAYRLQQTSKSTFAIVSGRKKVGFVSTCPKGYVARLGKFCESAPTPTRAFELVTVKALGFETVQTLELHNAIVRENNRLKKIAAAHAVGEALENKNFEPMLDLLTKGS